jgi:hypothetical protein
MRQRVSVREHFRRGNVESPPHPDCRATVGGQVALRPIAPADGAPSFVEAEQQMRAVLRLLTWEEISARREWTYADWLEHKIGEPGPIPASQSGGAPVLVAQ